MGMLDKIYEIEMKLKDKNRRVLSLYYIIMTLFLNLFYKVYLYMCIIFRKRKGIVSTSNSAPVIVSLTSFPTRIKTAKLCIETIMHQSYCPDRIILWLAEEQFPDKKYINRIFHSLIKRGLEIKYCDDLRSHKKYYYTFKLYPHATVITLDDDVFYPTYTLERLINESKSSTGIICNMGKIIKKHEGKISPYNVWESIENKCSTMQYMILPVGVGGGCYILQNR